MNRETLTSTVFFAAMLLIGLAAVYPRFSEGLPMGIDSPSHLFKILYSYKVFKTHGYFPAWCTDWYGGTPFLFFYPPFSYVLTFSISLLDLGPVLAYNVVDAFFYIIAPFSVYILSRSLGFKKAQSLFAGLLFSLTPILLENFLFYDRFTTIISVPLLCLFIASVIKALETEKSDFLVASSLLMTALILIHHLTAYYLGIILLLLIFTNYMKNKSVRIALNIVVFTVVIPFFLSAFWVIPFVKSIPIQVANPFYNRSNTQNFISPEGLMGVVFPLGLQFLLAILDVTFQMFPSKRDIAEPINAFKLLFPSASIIAGSIVSTWWLILGTWWIRIGQSLVVLGFISFLAFFFEHVKKGWKRENNLVFCVIWFISFLWLGIGSYGVFFTVLPFSKSLDVLRFRFYLAIPQSILAGKLVDRLLNNPFLSNIVFRKTSLKRKFMPLLLVVLLVSVLATSFWVAKNMTYRANASIPLEVINFFKHNSEQGRILPIKCPHWIYVLPYYTEKPIIDGWYPQEKLLKPLLEINDYQINTLNMYPESNRTRLWSNLIGNSSRLALKWVMIGNQTLTSIMAKYPQYDLVKRIGNITIYESKERVSLVEVDRLDLIGGINLNAPTPDHMILSVEDVKGSVTILVKMADFQGWEVRVDGVQIEHSQTGDGFISFVLEPGSTHEVNITYERQGVRYLWFSLVGLFLLVGLYVSSRIRRR